MSHEHCSECGALLADREEIVEGCCWRCIFQRDWAHVTAHPAQRRAQHERQQQQTAQQHQWLKTKYYPVDVSQRVIYDDPQRTEGRCSLNGKYRGHHTIGVRGARISEHAVYQTFIVKGGV